MSARSSWHQSYVERNTAIVEAYDAGATLADLAALNGVQPERIRHILWVVGRALPQSAMDPTYPERALKVAAALAGANVAQLRSEWRAPPELVRARFAFMSAMRKRGVSYPQIGRRVNRDHSSVMYGCRRADHIAKHDAGFAEMLAQVDAA